MSIDNTPFSKEKYKERFFPHSIRFWLWIRGSIGALTAASELYSFGYIREILPGLDTSRTRLKLIRLIEASRTGYLSSSLLLILSNLGVNLLSNGLQIKPRLLIKMEINYTLNLTIKTTAMSLSLIYLFLRLFFLLVLVSTWNER